MGLPNIESTIAISPHFVKSAAIRIFFVGCGGRSEPVFLFSRRKWIILRAEIGTGFADVAVFVDTIFVFSIRCTTFYLAFHCDGVVGKLKHL